MASIGKVKSECTISGPATPRASTPIATESNPIRGPNNVSRIPVAFSRLKLPTPSPKDKDKLGSKKKILPRRKLSVGDGKVSPSPMAQQANICEYCAAKKNAEVKKDTVYILQAFNSSLWRIICISFVILTSLLLCVSCAFPVYLILRFNSLNDDEDVLPEGQTESQMPASMPRTDLIEARYNYSLMSLVLMTLRGWLGWIGSLLIPDE